MKNKITMAELSPLLTQTLQNGGEVILTVTGISMLPLLRPGRDKVCLERPPGYLKKYAIPLFVRQDGRYVLHRIVSVKPEGYEMLGDNQWRKEYPVLHTQVLGVVTGFFRNDRYISCDNPCYLLYCRIWCFFYPIRQLYLKSRHFSVRFIRLIARTRNVGEKNNEG